jgi:ubiquinol-cytochrome c reductase cytochrome b subunit
MFLDGSTRLRPAWERRVAGYTVPALFWPTLVLPGLLTVVPMAYPFIEARLTKDKGRHNLLQRPRDMPERTGLGAAGIAFYLVLLFSGGNDIIADKFEISLNAMTWGGRIALLIVPPLAYYVTRRICLGLQQHDRQVLDHGVETGIIKLLPSGQYVEVHQPLAPADDHGHGELPYAGWTVPKKMNRLGALGPAIRGFFRPIEEPAKPRPNGGKTPAEIEAKEEEKV